jgi:uncharacterized protein with FMN-binding domain
MSHQTKRFVGMALFAFLFSMLLNGCIPPNEHVGKPAPHSYKDGYYDGYYYGEPYNGAYYYR